MKTGIKFSGIFVLSILMVVPLGARSKRVSQIPNGNVNRCSNCHLDPNGGGPRNPFGLQVQNNYLDASGNVIWGPALAALDADGDGAPNGLELQDPQGLWVRGQANPGDPSLVTKPGDASSVPTGVEVVMSNVKPEFFTLEQNYPNPLSIDGGAGGIGNSETEIHFNIAEPTSVKLQVFNSLGQLTKELVNDNLSPGHYATTWDGRDQAGQMLPTGIYFYRVQTRTFSKTMRMVLMR